MEARLPKSLRPARSSGLIRLGDVLDGGYVVSKDALLASDFLLSFGISTNWEFEKAFVQQRKLLGRDLEIHAYDHTVDAASLRIHRLKQLARYGLSLDPKHLASWKMAGGFRTFFDGRRAKHFKQKVWWEDGDGCVGVRTIMDRVPSGRRIFVKMDIEGSEYRVAGDLARFADRIVGMVVEFHDLDILRSNFELLHRQLTGHYDVAHIHANSVGGLGPDAFPNILEITYEQKGLGVSPAAVSNEEYPLAGLDKPNALDRPEYRVVFV
jgi:hypothetical protein